MLGSNNMNSIWNKLVSILVIICFSVTSTTAIAACKQVSQKCVDSTPCKQTNGINACLQGVTPPQPGANVNATCWKYDYVYDCGTGTMTDSPKCNDLRKQGCYETKVSCIKSDASGCTVYERQFFCPDPNNGTPIQDCSAKSYCMDGACFSTSYKANPDMARAVAVMEFAREVGNYLNTGIFKGVPEGCREGYGGVRDCCSVQPAGQAASISNQALLSLPMGVVSSAASYAWQYACIKATPYVYDVVTNTLGPGVAAYTGLTSAAQTAATSSASFNWNFSFAGFGYTTATGSAAATAGPFGTSSYALGNGFYFSPVGFAIFAVAALYGALSSCKQSEQMLALKRGANVCQPVPESSYCSSDVLGSCQETTHMFCCFNSIIAKVVNVAAKGQLGISMSRGKGNPNCDPITIDQLQQVDFSKVDFSEFYNSIVPGGHDANWWQSKVDEVQKYQDSRTQDCSTITDPAQKDACQKSGMYQENDQTAKYSSRASGANLTDNNQNTYWQSRADQRVDYSSTSGKADTQTPP